MQHKVILDCDPGDDDALAILLAHQYCTVIAVTTVAGNSDIANTTRNAGYVLDLIGAETPLFRGSAQPMAGSYVERPADIHGEHGLTGVGQFSRPVEDIGAVDFLIEKLMSTAGITIIATGPLTNVATAIQREPRLEEHIERIVLMGGTTHIGNRTPVAETNVLNDPEAARIVFRSKVPKVMIGLDVTRRVTFTPTDLKTISVLPGTVPAFFTQNLGRTLAAYERRIGRPERPLHDPCAVLAVCRPDVFDLRELPVDVELYGELTRGMTVVDMREQVEGRPSTATVALSVQAAIAKHLILDSIEQSQAGT